MPVRCGGTFARCFRLVSHAHSSAASELSMRARAGASKHSAIAVRGLVTPIDFNLCLFRFFFHSHLNISNDQLKFHVPMNLTEMLTSRRWSIPALLFRQQCQNNYYNFEPSIDQIAFNLFGLAQVENSDLLMHQRNVYSRFEWYERYNYRELAHQLAIHTNQWIEWKINWDIFGFCVVSHIFAFGSNQKCK